MKRNVGLVVGLALVPTLVIAGHEALMFLGEDPDTARHMAWAPAGDRVLLGNSVTASALDPNLLQAQLYTADGSGPAHWWAAARHRVPSGTQVVLYTAPASWNATAIEGHEEELLLADILAGPDDELTSRVLDAPMNPAAVDRNQARRTLHSKVVRLSWWPAEAWFGAQVDGDAVEPALERLHEGRPPHEQASWVTPTEATTRTAPDSIHDTLLPDLAAEDIDLVVVFPALRPEMLGPCTGVSWFEGLASELNALGVPVIDMTWSGGEFLSEHHQTEQGRQRISALLKPELARIQAGETRVLCP